MICNESHRTRSFTQQRRYEQQQLSHLKICCFRQVIKFLETALCSMYMLYQPLPDNRESELTVVLWFSGHFYIVMRLT